MPSRKLNILLADDDKTFKLLVARVFSENDELRATCSVQFVSDGDEAVDYVRGVPPYDDRARFPKPQLVILDQRMIRMDGSEALAAIRASPGTSSLPVCIMSSSSEESLYGECYRLGATFCMRIPLQFEAMTHKMALLVKFARDVLELQLT